MTNKHQLLKQIQRALQQNQMDMLGILLQDEDEQVLNQIAQQLKNNQLKTKYQEHRFKLQQYNKLKKQQIKNQDQIRKINAALHKQQSQSDQNIVQKQIKKKKQIKIQQKFGYNFYGNIKCLMAAYGDLKAKQQSIKMMHSQIQILFQIILKGIQQLQTGKKITQASIRKGLSAIFQQQVKSFQQITKQYKKAAKSTKKKQIDDLQYSEQNDLFSEDQNKQSLHMNINTMEEGEYFALLTKKMPPNQYQIYSQCRSINFLTGSNNKKNQQGLNKFMKFLDSNTQILKPQMRVFELLSFICCRLVRKIVFKIIRLRNQGKLIQIVNPLQQEQIRKVGNQLISQYEKLLKTIKQQGQSINQIAKRKFIQDLTNNNFKSVMPRKYSQSKKTAQGIWDQSKLYQQMWEQRILGQRQIDKQLVTAQDDQIYVQTQYGKFIEKYLQFYKTKGSDWLWRKYFTQEKIQDNQKQENKNAQGRPKKRNKLESLKD